MYRNLLICAALCCLPGCLFPPPGTPSPPYVPLSGNWHGTLSSSWGDAVMTATLANDKYTPTLSGSFALQARGATGKIYGNLDTRAQEAGRASFWGTVSVSYLTPSGESCNGTGQFGGIVTEQSVSLSGANGGGFAEGNCQDPPVNVRITLRR
jgi:hypothetical protein